MNKKMDGLNQMEGYQFIQQIAQQTLMDIRVFIRVGMTEIDIAAKCVEILASYGVDECWYHGVPALVLIGDRTVLSVSGPEYAPADHALRETDLITIDLSPQLNGYWGDCARSYVIEQGEITDNPKNQTLREGLRVVQDLHAIAKSYANPLRRVEDFFLHMNEAIERFGYVNLDFLQNIGHSIERELGARRYIERGNQDTLSDLFIFTFEPHIQCKTGELYGFKWEEIYLFNRGDVEVMGMH